MLLRPPGVPSDGLFLLYAPKNIEQARSEEGSLMGIDIARPLCGIQRDINRPSGGFGR